MLLKIVYLLVHRILGLAVLLFRTDMAKDYELLVLRHENAVLRQHAGRVRYERRTGCGSPRWRGCSPPAVDRNLPRHARDAAGLAPQAGPEQVRHE